MADHVRKQIRAGIAAALLDLPTTGPRVHVNRSVPVDPKQGAALVVFTPHEELKPFGLDAPQMYERVLLVVVKGVTSGLDLDDKLDQIGREVEPALEAAGTLGGLLKLPLELTEVKVEVDESRSPKVGDIYMAYRATTYTTAAAPDAVI